MKIRAVQIDLARQIETVDYVLDYADFARRCGMNTLVLYIEGRVRTPTFPHMDEAESYSADDVRAIVRHARRRRLDVIPVVSPLGHTEMFLQFPELRPLAELADGRPGRFSAGGTPHMTCPSHPGTLQFFGAYFRELAELFPSPYFHAGLDESWDIGYCDRCGPRVGADGGGHKIFSEFVGKVRDRLADCGKTMMMWDDMFEFYPAALADMPRDIVQCTWCYDDDIQRPYGHFLHRAREDVFRQYDRLGIPYLFCSAARTTANTRSFTRYAESRSPLGGLLTVWERSRNFNFELYPRIAYAGRLWTRKASESIDDDALLDDAVATATGVRDRASLAAMRFVCDASAEHARTPIRAEVFPGPRQPVEIRDARGLDTLQEALRPIRKKNVVLEDTWWALEEVRALAGIRDVFGRVILADPPALDDARLDGHVETLRAVERARRRLWRTHRPGIPAAKFDRHYAACFENLDALRSRVASARGFLVLRLFLPDRYSLPRLDVETVDGRGKGRAILAGAVLKPEGDETPYYEYVIPLAGRSVPRRVRLAVSGYGGQGLAHLRILRKGKTLAPVSVLATEGVVEHPAFCLGDDLRWTWFGERDAGRGFRWPSYRDQPHAITLELEERA